MGTPRGGYSDLAALAAADSPSGATEGVASPGFESIEQQYPVTWAFKSLSPSARVYIRPQDLLAVSINNTAPAIDLIIGLQILRSDGQVAQVRFDLSPPTDGSTFNTTFELTEGFLLSAAMFTNELCFLGQCFVTAGIQSDAPAPRAVRPLQLIQSYIGEGTIASWPQGQLRLATDGRGHKRVVTGSAPAAGAEILDACPLHTHWDVHAIFLQLSTSAVAGNRQVLVLLDDGVTVYYEPVSLSLQAASLTFTYELAAHGQLTVVNNGVVLMPLFPGCEMRSGWRLRTQTVGIQAGDQWAAPVYQVEERRLCF